MSKFTVGVDIGGTFTDIVVLDRNGRLHTKKVSSTVSDYALAIIDGLNVLLAESGLSPIDLAEVRHGTTVASNAILERKGARTGLITTKGFRDVLEIRTLRMPRLYDISWEKPPALVERYLRMVVTERVNTHGEVQIPLDPVDARQRVEELLAEGVEAIAVCLINSYANPAHERILQQAIEAAAPGLPYSISSDVLPEIKEYERTSTTVINTYVKPVVARYLDSLCAGLRQHGVNAPLLLMQSNGGLTTAEDAAAKPMNIIESGPAGGVIGAEALSRSLSLPNIITFDMGGTTAKASLIENGNVSRASEYHVGGGIMIGARLMTGAGYALKVPAVDLAEVGAGGGSIVRIDAGGGLKVGPDSAGAHPGPLCYDRGGTEPTVTDANLILGYINPDYLVGGELRLSAARARSVFAERIAQPLGLDVAHAAYGAYRIAASNMIRAIRAVSTERGRDPRDFALFAFGGNGPIFSAAIARDMLMRKIVIPPSPGLFSAFGLIYAEVEHHFSRTFRKLVRAINPKTVGDVLAALEENARGRLQADGFQQGQMRLRRTALMHYHDQTYELPVAVPDGPFDMAALLALETGFGDEHEKTYGHRAGVDEPVEIVGFQVVGIGLPDRPTVPSRLKPARDERRNGPSSRSAYFGTEHGWLDTKILGRNDIAAGVTGPCIIEEYDATTVVPPGWRAELDAYSNILISL
jgi:N-methylhydantoinase A